MAQIKEKELEIILDQIQFEFDEKLRERRKVILDIFEGLFEHTDQWTFIRQKLLKFLGDAGLRGDFLDIIVNAKRVGVGNEIESR